MHPCVHACIHGIGQTFPRLTSGDQYTQLLPNDLITVCMALSSGELLASPGN